MKLLSFILLIFICPVAFSFRDQIVGVRGKLTCNNRVLQGARVSLIERNLIGVDVILAENKTSYQGTFEAVARGRGLFDMTVDLKLFHSCTDREIQCQRTVSLRIPSLYIQRGATVKNYFEVGTMDMAFRYPGEQRFCAGYYEKLFS